MKINRVKKNFLEFRIENEVGGIVVQLIHKVERFMSYESVKQEDVGEFYGGRRWVELDVAK